MKTPKISVVIPVYNVEKYLKRCLDSLLSQTFSDWEAICINDASPDNCDKILAEYASRDKRFKVLNKNNGGVSRTRNDGIKKATGKYIMFLDSDDCIHPQTMEILYYFVKNNNADIVSFRTDADLYKKISRGADVEKKLSESCSRTYNINKIKYRQTANLINYATERNHRWGRFIVRHCYPVIHLFKRDLLSGLEFNDKIKICEDFPFLMAVLARNPNAVILDLPLYFYIPNQTSALKTVGAKKLFDNVSVAIMNAFDIAEKSGQTERWIRAWRKEFLWPFIIICMRTARRLPDAYIKKQLVKMKKKSIFENPPTMRACKYKRRIEKVISQI